MSPDPSPNSPRVSLLTSLRIAVLSSKHYTAFFRFQDFDHALADSYLVVPGEHVYADFEVSNAENAVLQNKQGPFTPETFLVR